MVARWAVSRLFPGGRDSRAGGPPLRRSVEAFRRRKSDDWRRRRGTGGCARGWSDLRREQADEPLKCRSHGLRARCAAPESVRGHQNRTQMRRWRAEGSSAHRPRQCGNSVTPTTPTLHPQQHRRAVCDPLKIGPPHTQKKGRLRRFSSLRRFMVQTTPSNVSMDIRTTLKHLIN